MRWLWFVALIIVIWLAAGVLLIVATAEAAASVDITLTQACLAALGFPVGPIDGKIGPQTIRAYRAWERSRFGALGPHLPTARKAERLAQECPIEQAPAASW